MIVPWVLGLLPAVALGCMPGRDQVFAPVAADVATRVGPDHRVEWRDASTADARVRAVIEQRLADGLTLDDAVAIALINNHDLQAAFAALGVARAGIAAAGTPPNPDIEAKLRWSPDSQAPDVELTAVQDILGLLARGPRRGVARAELEAARIQAVAAVVDLVARVRRAYHTAQAAEQHVELGRTVLQALDASYTLARRLHQAGNITDLELLRERALYEQARIDLADAETARQTSRDAVNRVLGLWGRDTAWNLAARLEPPPAEELALVDFERRVVARSLDLEAERWNLSAAGRRIGVARLERWLPALGLGVSAERDGASGGWGVGPVLVVGLPLWDRNTGELEAARALLAQAQHRYTALAVDLRARARQARDRLRAARLRAERYRDTVLPLSEALLDETQRARNAMAASTFELLAARRQQIDAGAAYVDALLEYWLARTEAETLLAGRRPAPDTDAGPAARNRGAASEAPDSERNAHP